MNSITYTWNVTGVKTRTEVGQEGFVFQTYWTKTGVDESGNEGVFVGATPLKPDTDAGFTPFEQLTEELVLGWIQAAVAAQPGYEAHINGQIQKQIDAKSNPALEPSLPWVPVSEVVQTEPDAQ